MACSFPGMEGTVRVVMAPATRRGQLLVGALKSQRTQLMSSTALSMCWPVQLCQVSLGEAGAPRTGARG